MYCQGYTQQGRPCTKRAGRSGYCHLHVWQASGPGAPPLSPLGGPRLSAGSPQSSEPTADSMATGIMLVVVVVACLLAFMGDGCSMTKVCKRGKPCGNTCISPSYTCHQ